MPGQPSAYEQARQRMRALRAAEPPSPPARTWLDSARDYGSSLGESALGAVEGIKDMFDVTSGNTDAIARHTFDWADSFNRFREGSNTDRAKSLGVGAVEGVGIPLSQLQDDYQQGNYAKMAGHATIPLITLGLGARSMMKGPVVEPPRPAPPTPRVAPAPRVPAQLPGFGGTSSVGTRFFSGDAGVADATTPYRRYTGNPNPMIESGTPTLMDVGEVVTLPPELAAQGYGPQGIPPKAVGAQMTDAAAVARKNMLGERARTPKLAKKISKKTQEALRNSDEVAPVPMPGIDRRTLFRPKTEAPPQEKFSSTFKSEDPGVLGDVAPVDSRISGLEPPPIPKETKPVSPAKMPRPGGTRLRQNFGDNKAISETVKQSTQRRPYEGIRQVDLDTLVKLGDKKAIEEAALRAKNGGASNPTPAPTSSVGSRLSNERGSVDFSAGIEKAKGQVKKVAKKVPGVLADAQRAALLTGGAVIKSGLGGLGGLVSEVAERVPTQSPKRTLGDLKKVGKSIPEGIRRAKRGLRGEDDLAEAQRHLAPPGPLSKPALRLMAALDGPHREALEALGLSNEEALRRILNAKPASKIGQDTIAWLRKHPVAKNIAAPVGATTSINMLEQGLLRMPGVNMLPSVKKMDPATMIKGRTTTRGVYGAGAMAAGGLASQALGDKNYFLKGLLSALAGPYGLPLGLGMAFESDKSMADALDNLGNTLGREAPFRWPDQKISTEVKKRFTPAIIRQLTDEDAGPGQVKKAERPKRPSRPKRPRKPR